MSSIFKFIILLAVETTMLYMFSKIWNQIQLLGNLYNDPFQIFSYSCYSWVQNYYIPIPSATSSFKQISAFPYLILIILEGRYHPLMSFKCSVKLHSKFFCKKFFLSSDFRNGIINFTLLLCIVKGEQALRLAFNLIFYHLNYAECLLKSQHILS